MKVNIFGFRIDADRVTANKDTRRLVIRRGEKLIALVGASKDSEGQRKLFARTDLRGGHKLTIEGRIRTARNTNAGVATD